MKLLFDFFPILLFFIAFKVYGIFVATAVAIAASFAQVGGFWWKHRRFETMHLVTLGIIVVFGGATLLLQDRTFIMWKPSVVNWLFGAVFLLAPLFSGKTLLERMMGDNIKLPDNIWGRLNWMWVTFFVVLGFANLYVANHFFTAEAAWRDAAGVPAAEIIEEYPCETQDSSSLQSLCNKVLESEEDWVNFKLFGMLGLTLIFVVGQSFYLARHIEEEDTGNT